MAYTYETRMISARLFTESFERCARLGISINAAANYGLGVFVKAHQRHALYALGFSQYFFTGRGGNSGRKMKSTSLRIRHDYLDYMEMQSLNRNRMLNYAVVHVCTLIEDGEMFASAVSDGPQGRGLARRCIYPHNENKGEEGREK